MKKINFKALVNTAITFLKGVNTKTWIAVAVTAAVVTTGVVVGVSLSGHEHAFNEWTIHKRQPAPKQVLKFALVNVARKNKKTFLLLDILKEIGVLM